MAPKPHELRERCKPLEESLLHRGQRRDIERYQKADPQLASTDVSAIVQAAFAGQVDALVVTTDVRIWGRFEKATGHLEATETRKPNTVDLPDVAATAVHQQG